MDGWGFSRAGRAALRDFQKAKYEGILEEQPCQYKENPVLPNSFTQNFILFAIWLTTNSDAHNGSLKCPPALIN